MTALPWQPGNGGSSAAGYSTVLFLVAALHLLVAAVSFRLPRAAA